MRTHLAAIVWSAIGLASLLLVVFVDASGPSKLEPLFPDMDKAVHFVVYGMMAYLIANLLHESKFTDLLFLPLHCVVLIGIIGMSIELVQFHTPGRIADPLDVVADMLGAIVFLCSWYRSKKKMELSAW